MLSQIPAACRSKTRAERKGAPTFSTLVEVLSYSRWRVHTHVARSVGAILQGRQVLWGAGSHVGRAQRGRHPSATGMP